MTKNEILEYFEDINHAYNDCTRYDTLKRMIDELQEPCTDAISRQAVLDLPKNTERGFGGKILEQSINIEYIKALPPVTPAEKVGKWIVHPKGIYAHLICDKCLSNAPYDCRTNYCPNCGQLKMQEVQDADSN